MIEQTNGVNMNIIAEDLEKLSKKVDRLEKKIDLIIEHFHLKPKVKTSKPPMSISGITQYDM